jgi:hypothetical protein
MPSRGWRWLSGRRFQNATRSAFAGRKLGQGTTNWGTLV